MAALSFRRIYSHANNEEQNPHTKPEILTQTHSLTHKEACRIPLADHQSSLTHY